jgi:hypothetical protein
MSLENKKRKREDSPVQPSIVMPPPLKKINNSYYNETPLGKIRSDLSPADVATREELHTTIEAFVGEHPKIKPGSEEYSKIYLETIGGSEIAILFMGKVFNTTREDLIQRKINGPNNEQSPEACLWGSFFEKYIRLYIQKVCNMDIIGHDICIRDGAFRYSPDGIGVITREVDGSKVVLVEIKCPFTRIPDGLIPKNYKLQIWTGLVATEGLASYGLYVDAAIRKCRIDDIGNTPEYDRNYHCRDSKQFGKPVAWGLIHIYSKNERSADRIIDFGNAMRPVFKNLLKNLSTGKRVAKLEYIKFADGTPDITEDGIDGDTQSLYHIGSLGFKIMRVVMRKLDPAPLFKDRVYTKIDTFQQDLEKAKTEKSINSSVIFL